MSKKAGSSQATVIQFPLKLAHAITAHKIQGQTIPKPLKVALDIASIFDDAHAHVMLIRASPKALKELDAMNARSINQHPMIWKQQKPKFLKICSLNCMNLQNTFDDILCDKTLRESTVLALSETWLNPGTSLNIDGYNCINNCLGPGKGLTLYYSIRIFRPGPQVIENRIQMTKLVSDEVDIIAVYRSDQGNLDHIIQHLKNLIEHGKNTVVTGDLNISYNANRNNIVTKYLENEGFIQYMKEATHIKGRHIDHFYLRHSDKPVNIASIYRYSPYYSDHDAICATIELPEDDL